MLRPLYLNAAFIAKNARELFERDLCVLQRSYSKPILAERSMAKKQPGLVAMIRKRASMNIGARANANLLKIRNRSPEIIWVVVDKLLERRMV